MARFYGDSVVKDEIPDGDKHVILELGDGKKVRVSNKMLKVSLTKHSTNLTDLFDRQLAPVVRDVLQVMLDWDVRMGQIDYMFNMLKSSLEHNNQRANASVWGKEMGDRTMSDLDRALQPKEKDGNANNHDNQGNGKSA